MTEFTDVLGRSAIAVERFLDDLLAKNGRPEARLMDAMRHATLGGGKRIRPFIVLSSARLFNVA